MQLSTPFHLKQYSYFGSQLHDIPRKISKLVCIECNLSLLDDSLFIVIQSLR